MKSKRFFILFFTAVFTWLGYDSGVELELAFCASFAAAFTAFFFTSKRFTEIIAANKKRFHDATGKEFKGYALIISVIAVALVIFIIVLPVVIFGGWIGIAISVAMMVFRFPDKKKE